MADVKGSLLTRPPDDDPARNRALTPAASTTGTLGESGTAVGRYVLGDEIARGGMGVVYRALDPAFGRDVAVKLIQTHLARQPAACARFLEEAQITGQLEHPGIPPVHELGTLPDGRPFLAMKLIKGRTLAELLADEQAPGQSAAAAQHGRFVAIFENICQAMGYAHSRGVIHRDLKPQNVMVGAFGEVQVMDWGLAKLVGGEAPASIAPAADADSAGGAREAPPEIRLVDSRASSGASETLPGSVLGTPAYMPPEQAEGSIDQVDEQSDVFSLGAILCQILSGQPPYAGASAQSTWRMAVQGDVRQATSRLEGCGAEPELIALARRCLAFNKQDRPPDAGEVAAAVAAIRTQAEERARQADLDRLQAQADRQKAELRAEEQRKRRQVWLGLAATLLLGLIGSTALALWANHARNEAITQRNEKERQRTLAREAEGLAQTNERIAQAQRDRAEREKANAVAVRDFLRNNLISRANVWEQANIAPATDETGLRARHDITVRELLVISAREFSPQTIEAQFPDQPEVQAEVLETIGEAYEGIGDFDQALAFVTAATDLREKQLGPESPVTLASVVDLAFVNMAAARHTEGMALLQKTLERLEKAFSVSDTLAIEAEQTDPADAALTAVVEAVERRMDLRRSSQRPRTFDLVDGAVALLHLHRAMPRLHRLATLASERFGNEDRRSMYLQFALCHAYKGLGQPREAIAIQEELLARAQATLDRDDTLLVSMRMALAAAYSDQRMKPAEAMALWEKCHEDLLRILGPEHPTTLRSKYNVASSYHSVGRFAEALVLREEILATQKEMLGLSHPDTLATMSTLADSYSQMDRHSDALKLNEQAMQLQIERMGPAHPDTLRSMGGVAMSLVALGRHQEAAGVDEQALPLHKQRFGPTHPATLYCMSRLADQYSTLRRYEDELKIREELVPIFQKSPGSRSAATLHALSKLAQCHIELDQNAQALARFNEALAISSQERGPDHRDTLYLMNGVAFATDRLGRHSDAQGLYRQIISRLETAPGADAERANRAVILGWACRNMGVSLRSAGRATEALGWFARGQASIKSVVSGDQEAPGSGQCLLAIRLSRAEALEELKRYGEADTDWAAALEASAPATKSEIQAQREQWRARRSESD